VSRAYKGWRRRALLQIAPLGALGSLPRLGRMYARRGFTGSLVMFAAIRRASHA